MLIFSCIGIEVQIFYFYIVKFISFFFVYGFWCPKALYFYLKNKPLFKVVLYMDVHNLLIILPFLLSKEMATLALNFTRFFVKYTITWISATKIVPIYILTSKSIPISLILTCFEYDHLKNV